MAARYETDTATRNARLHRLQEIIHEEQPYTFMASKREMGAYDKRFMGVKWIPTDPCFRLNSWWLPAPEAHP